MFRSIIDDIQYSFRSGNMVTRLLIINIAIFVFMALFKAFTQSGPAFEFILKYTAVPGKIPELIYKPWTLVSSIFLHYGFFHVLWNMVGLYIFGRIIGDLAGDNKILPLYIFGGIFASLIYILSYQIMPESIGQRALGASGAVMAIAAAAAMIAPEYQIRLLLLGNVRIKYIVLAFIFFDLIGTAGNVNTGGHIAHLGGVLFGFLFVSLMGTQYDLVDKFQSIQNVLGSKKSYSRKRSRSKMQVTHRAEKSQSVHIQRENPKIDKEAELDRILDKINQQGYEKLNDSEKKFLQDLSKND
jgi:membrane associated rhomboid family serine protease